MAADRPWARAMVKKPPLRISRWGRPKEMFDTPRMVRHPSSSRISRTASRVSAAARGSALTVIARGSKITSFLAMPHFSASARMRLAVSSRSRAVAGIPESSSVRATTRPPYFFARGKTASMTFCFPLTELIMALPLYRRRAASMAAVSVVSICRGRSRTACSSQTALHSSSVSLISGRPTFTSRIWAPASSCRMPSDRI